MIIDLKTELRGQLRRMMIASQAAPTQDYLRQPTILRALGDAADQADEDLQAYLIHDPASKDPTIVAKAHNGFKAVLAYRLASRLDALGRGDCGAGLAARRLSEFAKTRWGAEIHPGARIANRFVLDHGFNTVIGETVTIGCDCMVLNDVTLGARGVSDNPDGPRHPNIGDRVQIAGGARLLGPIKVGNDAFVGAGVILTHDVPAGGRVILRSEFQYGADGAEMTIYGLIPGQVGHLHIIGKRLEDAQARLVDLATGESPTDCTVFPLLRRRSRLTLSFAGPEGIRPSTQRLGLELSAPGFARTLIRKSPGLETALAQLHEPSLAPVYPLKES